MKILNANLKIIPDSRKQNTLEATLEAANISVKASVPSGKSMGRYEAFVLDPEKAIKKFGEVRSQILNQDFETQKEFDEFLIQLDGTPSTSSGQAKKSLGGNLILACSLAFARLMAKSQNLELYQYIKSSSQLSNYAINKPSCPVPIFNVVNGGAHATNPQSKLDFQEFQIIPEVKDFGMAYGLGKEFYEKLNEILIKKFGKENVLLGDEAGFSCPFKNNEEAIEIMADLIAKYNYPLRIGLDVAASQFYKKNQESGIGNQDVYMVDGKGYSTEKLKDLYLRLIESYNILSIEDPFDEEAFDDFSILSRVIVPKNVKVITDDLTTTNPQRLKTAIDKKAGNAILVKLNQIGTLTETLEVIKLAYENNWQAVVSHRSGETMDDFIADLAVAVNAWGLKSGAPAAPERLAKYERVLKIRNQ